MIFWFKSWHLNILRQTNLQNLKTKVHPLLTHFWNWGVGLLTTQRQEIKKKYIIKLKHLFIHSWGENYGVVESALISLQDESKRGNNNCRNAQKLHMLYHSKNKQLNINQNNCKVFSPFCYYTFFLSSSYCVFTQPRK